MDAMPSSRDLHTNSLVHAAQLGDHDAFEALYQRYGASVFRTAYLLLGDTGRAEEITQDVFVQVYRKLHSYSLERGAFPAWLYTITVRTTRNARRRRWPWRSLDQDIAAGAEPLSDAPALLDDLLRDETQRHIWQAVQRLSEHAREVVVLRYYQDLQYGEIAQVLTCPLGTVKSRLNAAHTQLRRALEGEIHELLSN
jgi:RNA polymerase sigma-70 factor, ECF subfamily